MLKQKSKVKEMTDKPQNLKKSFYRLFIELKGFKILIIISLILAILGSILAIFAPNKLSDLTDEISNGLKINENNLSIVSKKITTQLSEENMANVLPKILNIRISDKEINSIMTSKDISNEDKELFKLFLLNKDDIYNNLGNLPDKILAIIMPDDYINGTFISSSDKISLLNIFTNKDSANINDNIGNELFTTFFVDGIKITGQDQAKFLNIMKDVDKKNNKNIYSQLDKMPKSIKRAINPNMNMKEIKRISLFLVILFLCSSLFNYIESISMTDVANKFAKKLRSKISTKINTLPLKYFDNHSTGDILSRVTNDIDTIAQSMNESLATFVSAITLLFGTIIMMFVTNWVMAITAILSSLIGFVFMFLILSRSQKYFVRRQVELGNINGHIEEIYSGLNVVKAYNGKKDADLKFDSLNELVYDANRKSQFLSGLMMPMMNFIGNFGYVSVCIVGALLTMNNIISFGVIVAFISYVRLFTSPLSQIAQSMTLFQSTSAASERVFEFVDEIEMKEESAITQKLDKNKVKGKIEFKDVSFKYDGSELPTINSFSAVAHPGEKIAIVGPTGAGKTTLVNLLMKFYEINSGEILIDGISTKDLTRNNIHELFTMVLQDAWLFNGTVKENIIYNRKNVKDEEVLQVCKLVGLDHFIKTLPHSYDSIISDDDSVSSGQRQLLTIARAMIDSSPFLILDEATSNVDTRTEELVSNAMDHLTEGKTSFIIAHRLSTIKNADLILVMKNGNIVEQGSHDKLMKQKGFYANLYNSQFEL